MVYSRNPCWDATSVFVYFCVFYVFILKFVDSKCPNRFPCGNLGELEFPLAEYSQPEFGLFIVECHAHPFQKIHLDPYLLSPSYEIVKKFASNKVLIRNSLLAVLLRSNSCDTFEHLSTPYSPSVSFSFYPNITLFECLNHNQVFPEHYRKYSGCNHFDIYDANSNENLSAPNGCYPLCMPIKSRVETEKTDLFSLLSPEYIIEWNLTDACINCRKKGGRCTATREDKFQCEETQKNWKAILLATVLPGSVLILAFLFVWWQRKRRISDTYLLSRNISSDPSSRSDIECGNVFFGIPIFYYRELEEATTGFDSSRELGEGGFGTVYYGKLQDGREVAIKHLYEHNYKRVEQFMNEVKILTCLRHPNLVPLYGCTSRRSRELLLVYEYIPNGTVADHIHGDRDKETPLPWPVRMDIAVETASALAYLHKSDVIHRDVKTNNILLDNNFSVKVADFGLSRLFPSDVTHISTAPQGTPGYVDPQYHQCYQLTDRSDVYSFGVVLIELISSMPAVDISRQQHEINLANLAISMIRRCAFNELIDPSLGFDSDPEVTRMITSVAELAFQCLQLEKDLRPSMDEVLTFLKEIRGDDEFEIEKKMETNELHSVTRNTKITPSPERDDVVLLKGKHIQSSPNSVTDRRISCSATASSSG